MELNKESFNNTINSGVSVVDFYAEWCGPCKMLAPIMEEVTEELKGKINVGKLNVDVEMDIAGKFGVSSIPTLIFFKDGQEVDRVLGVQSKDSIIAKANSFLN